MRRLILLAAIALAAVLVTPAPAHAETNLLVHAAPDDGYDAAIIATCSWEHPVNVYVAEGHKTSCSAKGVYVRYNEEVWCRETRLEPWWKLADARGWHHITTWPTFGCQLRRD